MDLVSCLDCLLHMEPTGIQNLAEGISPFPQENPSHFDVLDKLSLPGLIDIHCHFFPQHIFKLIWRYFDEHYWPIAYRLDVNERLRHLALNRVLAYTTLNYAHKPGMAKMLNEFIFKESPNWPSAVPFGTFYPDEDVHEYVEKAVDQYKFHGFKLHCQVSDLNPDDQRLGGIFKLLAGRGIPVVMHSGTAPVAGKYTGLNYLKPLLRRHPGLKLIVAHMGAYEVEGYLELMKDFGGLMLDTAMVFVDFRGLGIEEDHLWERIELMSDRIFFGSDFPNIPYPLSHPVIKLAKSGLSGNALKKIFYENGKRLLMGK